MLLNIFVKAIAESMYKIYACKNIALQIWHNKGPVLT